MQFKYKVAENGNTEVKYKYYNILLKYHTWVNIPGYFPALQFSNTNHFLTTLYLPKLSPLSPSFPPHSSSSPSSLNSMLMLLPTSVSLPATLPELDLYRPSVSIPPNLVFPTIPRPTANKSRAESISKWVKNRDSHIRHFKPSVNFRSRSRRATCCPAQQPQYSSCKYHAAVMYFLSKKQQTWQDTQVFQFVLHLPVNNIMYSYLSPRLVVSLGCKYVLWTESRLFTALERSINRWKFSTVNPQKRLTEQTPL